MNEQEQTLTTEHLTVPDRFESFTRDMDMNTLTVNLGRRVKYCTIRSDAALVFNISDSTDDQPLGDITSQDVLTNDRLHEHPGGGASMEVPEDLGFDTVYLKLTDGDTGRVNIYPGK